ncbi:hypothetical protein TRVA0_003S04236 [Trichomonascus vanleenenianus]|uniref:Mix17p n=1 Tax=Trichomonascus vanleenenianus TaxID=2268995 RepID=UPI003EC99F0F
MPRSRGGRAPAPRQQTRSSSTMAAPRTAAHPPPPPPAAAAPVQHAPPQAASQSPGLFAQMATTAAGVAVGSAVGHTLANGVSSIFGGGSSAPAEQPQQQMAPVQQQQQENATRACDVDARNFTKCLDENSGNMQICDWYLQQLKACQQAARTY